MNEQLDIFERLAVRYMRFTQKKSCRAIAQRLGVRPSTVRKYLRTIKRKTA